MFGIAAIMAAIGLCRGEMPQHERRSYAQIIHEYADRLNIDPLLVVAMVDHETGWKPVSISADREDYGLGQVRARYRPECSADRNPLTRPSRRCAREKQRLLNGRHNLRVVFGIIDMWRSQCRKVIGWSVTEQGWMQAYAGFNRPSQDEMCGLRKVLAPDTDSPRWESIPTPQLVQWELDRRAWLLQHLPSPQTSASAVASRSRRSS
jgi:hypothetical protein